MLRWNVRIRTRRAVARSAFLAGCFVLLVPAGLFLWRQDIATTQPTPAPVVPRAAPRKRGGKPAPAPTPKAPAEPPKPLENPPDIIRAVYYTGWSAGLKSRVSYLADLKRTTVINAVVIDIKDYSGDIAYRVSEPGAKVYGAVRVMIRDFDALVNTLHRQGIYVVARITCFQDPVLAVARPDLAAHRLSLLPKDRKRPLSRDSLWLDRKGLAWIDPSSRAAWEYVAAIAKDARGRGVDEVNFDYVRFPSDGNLQDMWFPHWDEKTPKHEVIRSFFRYLRAELAGVPISVDLFGLAAVNDDDLGIGQVIEDAYEYFDYVCPMVYPSHYARKFHGFPNPAEHPYEVVSYSMGKAVARLEEFRNPAPAAPAVPDGSGSAGAAPPKPARAPRKAAKLRPWLQDFNLGAHYGTEAVKAEIKAVEDALGKQFAGYMLWSPSNVYAREALKPEPAPPDHHAGSGQPAGAAPVGQARED